MSDDRCQGWRRYGGAFTLGRPEWAQCKEAATVILTVRQGEKDQTLPACATCWRECLSTAGITVIEANPLPAAGPADFAERG